MPCKRGPYKQTAANVFTEMKPSEQARLSRQQHSAGVTSPCKCMACSSITSPEHLAADGESLGSVAGRLLSRKRKGISKYGDGYVLGDAGKDN